MTSENTGECTRLQPADLVCVFHHNHPGDCLTIPADVWAEELAYVGAQIRAQEAS